LVCYGPRPYSEAVGAIVRIVTGGSGQTSGAEAPLDPFRVTFAYGVIASDGPPGLPLSMQSSYLPRRPGEPSCPVSSWLFSSPLQLLGGYRGRPNPDNFRIWRIGRVPGSNHALKAGSNADSGVAIRANS
jgi:hypothetical protein